jgi:hypothetical protein
VGTSPPLPLAYDDLPPGSDIRRDLIDPADPRGPAVYLTVPASSDLPPAVARQAMLDALAASIPLSVLLLGVSYAAFAAGLRINRIAGPTLPWAWGFFAIFCVALAGLVAWVRYGVMIDALRLGREQATVLAATPARLVVETSGPFGVASYDLPADRVASLMPARGPIRDERGESRRLWHLAVELTDARSIRLLPGRDERELRWVCGMVGRLLASQTPLRVRHA